MSSVTIICCYNNINLYSRFCNSIRNQDIEIDIVGIDNCNNTFSSCSKAYNYALKRVNTKYVIFSHQDIEFVERDTVSKFAKCLCCLKENDILGVAGRKEGGKCVITNIKHGKNLSYAGGQRVRELETCQTVDECFFGGYSSYFKINCFDEIICNNWHLLATEQCLRTLSRGGNVYVCDLRMIHYSSGKVNHVYNHEIYQLSKKYKKYFSYVSTSCRNSKTSFPFDIFSFLIYALRISINDIKQKMNNCRL